jgi:hypothetical protein
MLTFGIILIVGVLQAIAMYAVEFYSSPLFDIFTYLAVFSSIVGSCWFYVAGEELHKRLPVERQFNLSNYKLFVIIPVVADVAILAAPGVFGETSSMDLSRPIQLIGLILAIINDVNLAKALVSVETNRTANFGDAGKEFFLLLFFIIGVWWIQPRMTRLVGSEENIDPSAPLDHNMTE